VKSVSGALATHLGERLTTLATCWRVERRDGLVFGFTDHDRDLVVSGVTYRAQTGYRRAAIASRADLSVDDTEIEGILDAAEIDAPWLRAGIWDGAEVRIFLVNWADLSQGTLRLRRGRLGEVVARDDGTFRAELRGLAQALNVTVGELYTPECRADLGDARCKVPIRPSLRANSTAYALGSFVRVETDTLATGTWREEQRFYECTTAGTSAATPPTFNTTVNATTTDGTVTWTARMAWTLPATVASAPDLQTVVIQNTGEAPTRASGWFEAGVVVFETGLNAGVARDVLGWVQASRTLTLFLPLPFPAVAGDVLRIQPGCDKRLATCRDKFANRLNFRGEPYVPGDKGVIETGVA
jgi:hypothetical protein